MIYRQTIIKDKLNTRSKIIASIRKFFDNNNYIEVETPVRIPSPAPEENINAEPSGCWFLHTSPELCMKRLLSAGYERIFQFARCFRKQERGDKHLPEFTLLEWYTANSNYFEMMKQCEELVTFVANEIGLKDRIVYMGKTIKLTPPWVRISVAEAFEKFAFLTIEEALSSEKFDEIMAFEIEPHLDMSKPVFLYDYPIEKGALAKKKTIIKGKALDVAERFELYIGGHELCNAFSELTDRIEQTNRFRQEQKLRKLAGKTVYPMSDKFLNSLDQMPEACGNALGIDRLVMLMTDSKKIDDVVAFTPEEL